MKYIITESDLVRLVKKVIKEQKDDNGYMELVSGQTYEFFPVFPEEDILRINADTLSSDLFKMKILSYTNKVLEGMVGETKMVYNEKFFSPKSKAPQRYFCEKNNPKKCIIDTYMGYTKLEKRNQSKKLGDFMNPDKSQSLFSEVTDNNFDSLVLKSTVPFIVDFSAVWCGPCRMAAKTLTEIKREYGDKFEMGKLDIDVEKKTRDKYKISSIPVIMIFKNGKMVKKIEGNKPIEEYKREIDSIL
jgi:thioredoxin 1